MYRLELSAGIKAGKNAEMMQQAQEITNYVNENYLPYFQNKTQFGVQAFGTVGRIVWFLDYKNMALIEEYGQKLESDTAYQERVRKISDLIIEGSVSQRLFNIS